MLIHGPRKSGSIAKRRENVQDVAQGQGNRRPPIIPSVPKKEEYAKIGDEPDFGVSMIIPGIPVAMARPRFGNGRTYILSKQVDAKDSMGWQMAMAWGRPKIPRKEPVSMVIEFVFKAIRKKDIGAFRPLKPDVDNLAKMVLDAAIGIVYEDDNQVVDIRVMKRWGTEAHTKIHVRGCG